MTERLIFDFPLSLEEPQIRSHFYLDLTDEQIEGVVAALDFLNLLEEKHPDDQRNPNTEVRDYLISHIKIYETTPEGLQLEPYLRWPILRVIWYLPPEDIAKLPEIASQLVEKCQSYQGSLYSLILWELNGTLSLYQGDSLEFLQGFISVLKWFGIDSQTVIKHLFYGTDEMEITNPQ